MDVLAKFLGRKRSSDWIWQILINQLGQIVAWEAAIAVVQAAACILRH